MSRKMNMRLWKRYNGVEEGERRRKRLRSAESGTYLLGGDRSLTCLPKLLNDTRVTSEILLASNENDRQTSAEVHDFGNPLQVSHRMSNLQPRSSALHTFSWTLSSESGESTAKQMRMTWESG